MPGLTTFATVVQRFFSTSRSKGLKYSHFHPPNELRLFMLFNLKGILGLLTKVQVYNAKRERSRDDEPYAL
ncbi:hypothetical protein HanPI659440_Chr05g0200171 [Helianthus annuus]|nr:hypothetical protein HanPI659440_Chr05g0200171 [Helianthus annuus]